MIDINVFLKKHQIEIADIISNLKKDVEFSSHDFIEKFAQQHEEDYIEMLVKYQRTGNAFQTVHSLIAKYLSLNMTTLRIDKTERKVSENVFGSADIVQWWKKI
jgi:tRNA nucleotidyltransferase/poly(A) polymerase